jgi:two-component system, NarL family, sensor histidine kinase LiaS
MRVWQQSVLVRLTLSYIAVAMLTSLLIVLVSYGLGSVEWQKSERDYTYNSDELLSIADPFGVIQFDVLGISVLPFTLVFAGVVGMLSIPAALLLVWLTGYPLAKRLERVANASRRFADGDYQARVVDTTPDEVGQVAQQFNNMADALQQHVHLLRSLAQENAMLAQTAESAAAHAERIRLSQDLHDMLAQQLFSLTYGLSSLTAMIRQDPEAGAVRADTLAKIAEQALLEVRALLLQLRPQTFVEKGLVSAIREITQQWQSVYGIPINAVIALKDPSFGSVLRQTLCLILQEALANAVKHAHATMVTVQLHTDEHEIVLQVQDNGIGISTHKAVHGFGMTHMRERAEAVGGMLIIRSSANTGTCVEVRLPQ